jgi:hypothetical protein
MKHKKQKLPFPELAEFYSNNTTQESSASDSPLRFYNSNPVTPEVLQHIKSELMKYPPKYPRKPNTPVDSSPFSEEELEKLVVSKKKEVVHPMNHSPQIFKPASISRKMKNELVTKSRATNKHKRVSKLVPHYRKPTKSYVRKRRTVKPLLHKKPWRGGKTQKHT